MTVYSELLKLALSETPEPGEALDELVGATLDLRLRLQERRDPAGRVAASLAYDAALARLCDHVGVAHGLTDADADPLRRERAEQALAAVLPSLGAALR